MDRTYGVASLVNTCFGALDPPHVHRPYSCSSRPEDQGWVPAIPDERDRNRVSVSKSICHREFPESTRACAYARGQVHSGSVTTGPFAKTTRLAPRSVGNPLPGSLVRMSLRDCSKTATVNGKCFCNARAIGELEQLMGPLPSTAVRGGCLSGVAGAPGVSSRRVECRNSLIAQRNKARQKYRRHPVGKYIRVAT